MTHQPRQFTARELKTGRTVTGWYALHHTPNFDREGNKTEGYTLHHCLFNDEPGERTGGYWADIDPDTLQPVPEQPTLF